MSGVLESSRGACGDMNTLLMFVCTSLRHPGCLRGWPFCNGTFSAHPARASALKNGNTAAWSALPLPLPLTLELTAGVVDRECCAIMVRGLTDEGVDTPGPVATAAATAGAAGGVAAASSSSPKSAWRRSELLLCCDGEAGGAVAAAAAAAAGDPGRDPGNTKLAGMAAPGVTEFLATISLPMKDDAEPGVANMPCISFPYGVW